MSRIGAYAALCFLCAAIVSAENRGPQVLPGASPAQEVRTHIDVAVPNANLSAAADQVKAAFLAERLPIAESSTASVVTSGPIVKNPAARNSYVQEYQAHIIQAANGEVSVRLSATGQNGNGPNVRPYPLTSVMVQQTPGPMDDGWALLERVAARLRGTLKPVGGPATVAEAFRDFARDTQQKLILVADAMPADKYSFKPTPSQQSFGEVLSQLSARNDHACSLIGGITAPTRSAVTGTTSKVSLLARLQETVQFCDQALAGMGDSKLNELVAIDTRIENVGPVVSRTRAAAMTWTTAYWADTYQQLAQYLRLGGGIPPKPCGAGDGNCGSGRNLCQEHPTPGLGGLGFELSDAPYSVRSDSLGPYRAGGGNVAVVWAGYAAVMVLGGNTAARPSTGRSISIDLDHPVPGDIGVPLGVRISEGPLEVAAQWGADANHRAQSALDIPIGTTVSAEQTDLEFPINGVQHTLQMGPQPEGHCFSDGTAIYGSGTTRATIRRVDATTWVVDLPAGSIGRLFDVHLSYPHAVNKGLYYVSLHYVIRK